MQCMEVWGGNQVVDSGVAMAGLDAWVYSKPYAGSEGGGDVYYVSACATGRITRLLVADVSGHGEVVCGLAGELRDLMRRYVNYIDQGSFVRSMNERFLKLSQHGCFATAVVTTFFAPTNQLSLCNAGHPPPLIYSAEAKRWDYLERAGAAAGEGDDPRNVPLGVLDLADYDQFNVTLRRGDLVLCYTDSLIESRRTDGELLCQEGLIDIVRSVDPSDPATFTARLLAAVAATAEGNLTADDVTVLLFRPNTDGSRIPLRQKLLAPVRVLRGLARSLRPGGGPMPWPELSLANLGGALFHPLNRAASRTPDRAEGRRGMKPALDYTRVETPPPPRSLRHGGE